MFDIRLRDVPEHLVVSEERTVVQAEVSDYLQGAMARVHRRAEAYGGVAGTSVWPYLNRADRPDEPVFFAFYRGNPNEGPALVEVCAPVRGPGADLIRQPRHREAFVRVTRAQVAAIGEAFEAVPAWVIEQGLEVTGPPREVYFRDFFSAAESDEVFDVAFPVS